MHRIAPPVGFTSGLALIIAACGATEPEQEPTFTGSMEARIDGALWQAERAFGDYDTLAQMLWIGGSRNNSSGDTVRMMDLGGLPITGPGTVTLASDLPWGGIRDGIDAGLPVMEYRTTDTFTGTATVTQFDLAARRCSGTFSFTAVTTFVRDGPLTLDTVYVTNGSWTVQLTVH